MSNSNYLILRNEKQAAGHPEAHPTPKTRPLFLHFAPVADEKAEDIGAEGEYADGHQDHVKGPIRICADPEEGSQNGVDSANEVEGS